MSNQQVIELCRIAHTRNWRMSSDESTGDKLAAKITSEWQDSVVQQLGSQFVPEFPVAEGLRERIDLVDTMTGVAYELKVSPNNDHMEFFRDVFKVLVAKDRTLPSIQEFCFVCPDAAARRYENGLRRAVLEEGDRLGFSISVAGL